MAKIKTFQQSFSDERALMDEFNSDDPVSYPTNLQWLIDTYFSDPEKRIQLSEGEVLIKEGDPNDRLYLVLSGEVKGFTKTPGGGCMDAFRITRNRFVGGPSFFSKSFTSLTTVIAQKETLIAYIDQHQEPVFDGVRHSLEEQFMPFMVAELIHRQHRIQKIGLEKEKAFKALIHSEKMVSLGQISAGVAHELNNAVAVVKQNSTWFSRNISELLIETYPDQAPFFNNGLRDGRNVSSREARKISRELRKKYGMNDEDAFKIAQTGIPIERLERMFDLTGPEIEKMISFWEMGATLNDILIASNHAVHVVKSIKELGAQRSERKPGVDLNTCLNEATTLLASPLRQVTLETEMEKLPTIVGNKGELVQVFINIMQNACESMTGAKTPSPVLRVASRLEGGTIVIRIGDNGPGIPPNIVQRIFEPSITTKTSGRTKGLGLGLAICERLVDSYGGTIRVDSKPGETVFTIRIPSGEDHGKA